ncbi:cysteine-rich receptor-like protein kinase [Tanacetum coccineum]
MAFIRSQILDGALLANEIILFANQSDLKLLCLKVDFEKAFDSVCWSFLDDTMVNMGFREKWRSWIHGCLYSASVSVLVNGSPTGEFSMTRGIRQGDLLYPYLFLMVAESLHRNDIRKPYHSEQKFKWNSWVPRKINIFAWCTFNDRLPLLVNLDNRGLDVGSVLCPFCSNAPEDANHLLTCPRVLTIWRKVFSWWKMDFPSNLSLSLLASSVAHLPHNKAVAKVFQGVCLIALWCISYWRNRLVHKAKLAFFLSFRAHCELWFAPSLEELRFLSFVSSASF